MPTEKGSLNETETPVKKNQSPASGAVKAFSGDSKKETAHILDISQAGGVHLQGIQGGRCSLSTASP